MFNSALEPKQTAPNPIAGDAALAHTADKTKWALNEEKAIQQIPTMLQIALVYYVLLSGFVGLPRTNRHVFVSSQEKSHNTTCETQMAHWVTP